MRSFLWQVVDVRTHVGANLCVRPEKETIDRVGADLVSARC